MDLSDFCLEVQEGIVNEAESKEGGRRWGKHSRYYILVGKILLKMATVISDFGVLCVICRFLCKNLQKVLKGCEFAVIWDVPCFIDLVSFFLLLLFSFLMPMFWRLSLPYLTVPLLYPPAASAS